MLSPEELLDWAEKVRETVAPEPYSPEWLRRFVEKLPEIAPESPLIQQPAPPLYIDCNCPLYGCCMNTACPRAVRITNNLNGTVV